MLIAVGSLAGAALVAALAPLGRMKRQPSVKGGRHGSQEGGLRSKTMRFDEVLADDLATHEMLLNDSLEHRRVARAVPRALGINHGNWATLTDSKAVRFRAEDAAPIGKSQLLQTLLQKVPGGQPAFFLAAFGRGLIAAEKQVTPRDWYPDRRGNLFL